MLRLLSCEETINASPDKHHCDLRGVRAVAILDSTYDISQHDCPSCV